MMLAIGSLIAWLSLPPMLVFPDDEDVFRTETKAPLKVVVRRDSAIFELPDQTSNSQNVRMFEFFYVLKPTEGSDEKTKDDFYRIATGHSANDEIGWIHSDDVVEWPHRQALGLRPADGRDRAEFYKSGEDLDNAYNLSSDAVPTPISREPSGGGINLMPILERYTLEVDGDEVDGFRVAYLHSRSATASSAGGEMESRGAVDLQKATLDIVFVIDTTGSMQPFINATKEAVAQVTDLLLEEFADVPVRFGLIGYRDVISSPGSDWYVTKMICDLESGADHGEFKTRLSDTFEASQGSEDVSEDVLAGLKLAIQDAQWNPDAFKQIVLIGDASAHTNSTGNKNSEKLTVPGVLALAQPAGRETIREKKVLHAARIIGTRESDHALCERQFRQIAAGEDIGGEYQEFDTRDIDSFVEELVEIISKSAKGLGAAMAGQKPAQDTPGLGLLMEMLEHSENQDDPSSASDVPQFASGHACEIDRRGNQQLEPFVLVQYGRLELFASALDFFVTALRNAGEPGSKDVGKVVSSIQLLATQINMGEPVNQDTSPAEILALILGFPVRNQIFEMTFSKLAAMTDSDFQSWVRQVEASKSIIKSHLENGNIWFSLGQDNMPQNRRCFLKVKDLP